MRSFISIVLFFALIIVTLIILEGACFRLVENYAKSRMEFAWGKPGNGKFHPVLKKLPLSHFVAPPSSLLPPSERIVLEDQYATSLMSFGRPIRDRLQEEIETAVDPLAPFEIKDINGASHVVLPGMQIAATLDEVKRKMARRVGDPMEYAEGLLIRVVASKEKHIIEAELSRLQAVFKFLLDKGLACVVVSASSSQELADTSRKLIRHNPMIASDLYVWGDDKAADIILEVAQSDPALFKTLIVYNPKPIPSPRVKGMPWILLGSSSIFEKDVDQQLKFLSWLDRSRDADRLYPSRLGGLLKIFPKDARSSFESFAMPYLLVSLDYLTHSNTSNSDPISLVDELKKTNSMTDVLLEDGKPSRFDLFSLEEKIEQMEESEKISPLNLATYDCEVIREYRQIHADDSNLKKVSNRDLVLKLGFGFEQMGEEALNKIGEKDPLFFRFYNSLREVQESPFN
jgi:hypothetical protein